MKMLVKSATSHTHGKLSFSGKTYNCMLGKGGIISAQKKTEGDGSTPAGTYKILRGFYRSDMLKRPRSKELPMTPIQAGMGWEDSPTHARYNCLITENYPVEGTESFMRKDHCYNVILVLNHNNAWPYEGQAPKPATPGKGSAIFIHTFKCEQGIPEATAGCIALAQADLLEILPQITHETYLEIIG